MYVNFAHAAWVADFPPTAPTQRKLTDAPVLAVENDRKAVVLGAVPVRGSTTATGGFVRLIAAAG